MSNLFTVSQIADRIGTGKFFPYENMEELVEWQLEGTGFKMEDFEKKGFVAYGKKQIFKDLHEYCAQDTIAEVELLEVLYRYS